MLMKECKKEISRYLVGYVVGKPVQTLIKTLPRGCTGALDVPESKTKVY